MVAKLLDHNNRELNPLSPNSDQQQFSPNDIHTLSRDYLMRIDKMIAKEKMPSSFINFSQLIRKEMYGDQFGEFVYGYWGLKGYVTTKMIAKRMAKKQ